MFGKIFESMYDGTLADNWQALVTFQQMIVLADEKGVVDMTPGSLARRTGIPLEIIKAGLAVLEAPDEYSRSPECDGRRIELLDEHRPWGWRVVNSKKYRDLSSREEKRAADRQRIAERRAQEKAGQEDKPEPEQPATESDMSQGVAECRDESQTVADVAHTDTDTDTKTPTSDDPTLENRNGDPPPCPHREIIRLWNQELPELPAVDIKRFMTKQSRKDKLSSRWKEDKRHQSIEFWEQAFGVIRSNPHWLGNNDRGWRPNFDWFLEPRNFEKLYERADLIGKGVLNA